MIGLIPICLIVTLVHIAIHLSLVLLKNCGIPQGQGSVLGLTASIVITYHIPDLNQAITLCKCE